MNCPIGLAVVCLLAFAYSTTLAAGDKPAGAKPIHVLFTYGGHGFDEKPFYKMLDALPGITYEKAKLPQDADLLKPGLEKRYDAIVMYDMAKGFTPWQEQQFVALLNAGIGVVSLHHNLCSHDDWQDYGRIIGGRYFQRAEMLDGKAYPPSHYIHDQHYDVHVADPNHPITRGLSDFHLDDETYWDFWVAPDAHVLLTVDHPKCGHNVAWITRFGNSPVFYMMFGHGPSAWQNPIYPELLTRAIRWASAQKQVAQYR